MEKATIYVIAIVDDYSLLYLIAQKIHFIVCMHVHHGYQPLFYATGLALFFHGKSILFYTLHACF
jgi:hypothetical protein